MILPAALLACFPIDIVLGFTTHQRPVRPSLSRPLFSSLLSVESMISSKHKPKPFHDPFMSDSSSSPGLMLTKEFDERISSVLLSENIPSPADALPIVAAELRELLLPEDESGRVSSK